MMPRMQPMAGMPNRSFLSDMDMPSMAPNFGAMEGPTQVAQPMEAPASQPMRSVLRGRAEQEMRSEDNIRRLLEQLRGSRMMPR